MITGIDIGGTHITVCLVDVDSGKLLEDSRTRVQVDTSLDKQSILTAWANAIRQAHERVGTSISKIGVAMPGPFDYENGVSYIRGLHKYESLYGLNVKQLLADELRVDAAMIKMMNDASAYLLGEISAGAAKGADAVVGVTLGTGLGSALYEGGVLHEGDLYCTDFRGGKCEDFASARWIKFEYEKLSGIRVENVKEIAERYNGEDHAKLVFERLGINIAEILHQRYNQYMPCTVVIGGNIARAWQLFVPAAERVLEKLDAGFRLVPAVLGEDAALAGSAYLWREK